MDRNPLCIVCGQAENDVASVCVCVCLLYTMYFTPILCNTLIFVALIKLITCLLFLKFDLWPESRCRPLTWHSAKIKYGVHRYTSQYMYNYTSVFASFFHEYLKDKWSMSCIINNNLIFIWLSLCVYCISYHNSLV